MPLDEEEALFVSRVKQINRDCLATFMPYIKAVIYILLFIGGSFLSLTIYYYKDTEHKIDNLINLTTEDGKSIAELRKVEESHGREIEFIKDRFFK